jgi:DNA-binding NtrC family response regulator
MGKTLGTDKKIRILIVDDESDLRNLLNHVLTQAGYEVVEAPGGEEALNILQRETFDIAFLDIQMPNINGIQVLKYLQKNSPSTKAIMLTGYAGLKNAMEAKQFGATDFINKPYNIEDILATVERLVNE